MSLRDSWVRVSRGRARDPRTGTLSPLVWAVLDQVWAIAADEGEVRGDDVACPAGVLEPAAVLLELPRHPSVTLEAVVEALEALEAAGCVAVRDGEATVHALARYNRDRFRKRDWARERRSEDATAPLRSSSVDATATPRSVPVPEDSTGQYRTATTTTPPTILPSVGAAHEAPSPAPAKPKAPRKPRKPPTGPHAEFIAWWEARYAETQGTPYVGRGWAAEGPQVARLLKALGPDELRARAERLLVVADDEFLASTDRGIGVLATCCNKPALRGMACPSPNGTHRRQSNTEASLEAIARVAQRLETEQRAEVDP